MFTNDDISAVVLAAGLGTRIRSVGKDTPKAMLPISEHPYLCYLVSWLLRHNLREVLIATGWQGHLIEQYFSQPPWNNLPVRTIDVGVVGTGTTLLRLSRQCSTTLVLAMAGDVVLEFDLNQLLTTFESSVVKATFVTTKKSPQNEGAFRVDDRGHLIYSEEARYIQHGKPDLNPHIRTSCTGTAMIDREYLASLTVEDGQAIEHDLVPALINNDAVNVFDNGGAPFYEFGVPQRYDWLSQNPEFVRRIYGNPVNELIKPEMS